MNSTHWSDLQEKGTLLGIKILLSVYQLFGRVPFLIILYPVVLYYFLFSSTARNASIHYLQKIRAQQVYYPDRSIYYLSYRHFLSFAQGLLDKVIAWLGAFSYEQVEFPGKPKFHELMESKKGALIIGSHLGNLEIMRALSSFNSKIRLNILVHTKHAETFNRLFKKADETAQLNMIQVSEISPATAIMMQDRLAKGEFIVIVGDRVPVNAHADDAKDRTSVVNFLGAPAPFSQGPYLIASILKCPVYTLFCLRKNDKYEITFEPFAERIKLKRGARTESLAVYVQKFAQVLEQQALKAPLQWYNFFPYWLEERTEIK